MFAWRPKGGRALGYVDQVVGSFGSKVLAEWPMADAAGTVIADASGNNRPGAYNSSGITLGQPGMGDGLAAPLFAASWATWPITAIGPAMALGEFSFGIWAKVLNVGVWNDGTNRQLMGATTADGKCKAYFYKVATDGAVGGRLSFNVMTNSVNYGVAALTVGALVGWFHVGLTFSLSGNKIRWWLNGHQEGATQTGFAAWAGALNTIYCVIGANNNAALWPWSGWLAHAAVIGADVGRAGMRQLAYTKAYTYPLFFGDSIVAGTGASDAPHRWVNIVAAAKGWGVFNNQGVGGTVLQNTAQNSVSTLAGPVDGNGRDTYAARVTAYHPDVVCILYGTNDLRLNDAAITAAQYGTDLGEIVDGIVADGTPASGIVIGSVPHLPAASYGAGSAPWNGSSDAKHSAYVAAAAAVATAKGCRYVDVRAWMMANGGDALIGGDSVHPTDAGHAQIAAAFLSVL